MFRGCCWIILSQRNTFPFSFDFIIIIISIHNIITIMGFSSSLLLEDEMNTLLLHGGKLIGTVNGSITIQIIKTTRECLVK